MTVPDNVQAFKHLGIALLYFSKNIHRLPLDRIHNGFRIRLDRIEGTRHREDMAWEDLGLDSIYPENNDWRIVPDKIWVRRE